MSWIEPKTDWQSTDFNNIHDYNRQKGNVGYIVNDVLPALGYAAVFEPGEPVDWSDENNADRLNLIENGLKAIENSGVPLPPNWQAASIVWANGGYLPNYNDLNRWEGNVKAMYELAQRIAAEWPRMGTFESGGILI